MNRSPLRIAMIGHKRIPSREGGIEVVVEELSVRLAQAGHDVTVYNRTGHHVSGRHFISQGSHEKKEYKGVKIRNAFAVHGKGLAAASSSFFATMKALFGRYDCIHYHAEGPCVMLALPHWLGIRTVATIHGLDWQRSKWNRFAAWYLKLGEKIAAKYADEVIVLSQNAQRYFEESYGRRTIFIPNGVSRPEIREADVIARRWGLEKDSYLFFLSRIVPEKGLAYLIEAFQKVKTNKKLVIAGGSSDTKGFFDEMKQLAAEDTRILFTDFVQGRELEELYSNAYVYVLPSDLEGMPLTLLEAMSYGNCCLVSNIPECTEVVERKAVVFSKGDVDNLVVKLQMLCDFEEAVKHYKGGASYFICGKYRWDDVVEKTVSLY